MTDLQIAKNKKKSREGRYKNLAQMFVDREVERGPIYASMWLYKEFQIQGVEDMETEFQTLRPYIEQRRKEMLTNGLDAIT